MKGSNVEKMKKNIEENVCQETAFEQNNNVDKLKKRFKIRIFFESIE